MTVNAQSIHQLNAQIRDIVTRYFSPREKNEENPAVKQELAHGIECLISITAIFKCIETFHPAYVLAAIQTLVWGMDRNLFWKMHSATIVPIVQSGFNSYLTALRLENDKFKTPEKNELAKSERRAWIRIFPTALGCMWGAPRMFEDSHALMQEIDKIL